MASLKLTDLQGGQQFSSQLGWNIVVPVLMVAPAGFGVFRVFFSSAFIFFFNYLVT